MICSKCGYEISDQATFCPYCGQSVVKSESYDGTVRESYSQRTERPEGPERTERMDSFRSAPYPGAERSPQGTGYRTRPRPPVITLEDLPPELRPLSAWSYVGWGILFAIPLVGLILVIIFSCVSGNINRKRFARSYLCWLLIVAVVITILILVGAMSWNSLINGEYWPFLRR